MATRAYHVGVVANGSEGGGGRKNRLRSNLRAKWLQTSDDQRTDRRPKRKTTMGRQATYLQSIKITKHKEASKFKQRKSTAEHKSPNYI